MRTSLAGALDRGELAVHYQPIHDLRDMRLIGFEALARWERDGEWIPPAEFIPVAEESGLIVEIGRLVLNRACSELAAWVRRDPALADVSVAVNVSASQLAHADFGADVQRALDTTGLRPANLGLELTENVLMLDTGKVAERLVELSGLGVKLAIDDFGKGYSSLNYLVTFPIKVVKIDRAFVHDLPSQTNRAVIKSIASLCHSLGIVTVAEGIETQSQLAELRRLACDTGQGFWLGHPMPLRELTATGVRSRTEAARLPARTLRPRAGAT
jgi:Amt family ammonium transporter